MTMHQRIGFRLPGRPSGEPATKAWLKRWGKQGLMLSLPLTALIGAGAPGLAWLGFLLAWLLAAFINPMLLGTFGTQRHEDWS